LPRLAEGGLDRLRAWIRQTPDARVVVIDTLARVKDGEEDAAEQL